MLFIIKANSAMKYFAAALFALLFSFSAEAFLPSSQGSSGGGGGTAFTPLHTYYIAATGNDSTGNGTSGNPWLTPNHATVCGDVFVAAPGTYAPMTVSTQPTTCPSTTAGIDGTGGIYFSTVVCNGNLGSCVWTSSATSGVDIDVTANNWAFEGLVATSTNINASGVRGFQCDATASGTTIIHHVAFINDISYHNQQAFDMSDDSALNHNVPGNGCDYVAVVGSIAQNAANDPILLAAIDFVAPANFDSNAGTHAYIYGNFGIANNSTTTGGSDMECILADTLDAHGYANQMVVANNICYLSTRFGMQIFYQAYNTSAPTIKYYNNTDFANLTNVGSDSTDGDINFAAAASGAAGNPHWIISTTNNIARTNAATSNSNPIYAMTVGGIQWGAAGSLTNSGNVLFGLATTCTGTCDSTKSEVVFNSNPLGTQTYTDPLFQNTSDLLANWAGAPNCSSFTNVTRCMGYNANTSTLTSNTPIYDLVATAGGASGKGYQLPSVTCASNSDYPSWLKGVVYLTVSGGGSTITENPDLVTKPCGV